MSKLYCSNRCKQFGYNHKIKIPQFLEKEAKGFCPKQMCFRIEDYLLYNNRHKMLKRLKDLTRKKIVWQIANEEYQQKQASGLSIGDYLANSLVRNKITSEENDELCALESELGKELVQLEPKGLSLEQWSFLRSLHPSVHEAAFFEIVSSLSKDFLNQLQLGVEDKDANKSNLLIRHKFVDHCNQIALGSIQFVRGNST